MKNKENFHLAGEVGNIQVQLHMPLHKSNIIGAVAVVCHPHPLYGGTMDNKVVATLARCYGDLGIPVARFNFRGIGTSQGQHDNVMVVVDWLREKYKAAQVLLAGFSFGSAVVAAGSYRIPDISHLILVAPPVDRYDYAVAERFPCVTTVVMGDQDELVDAETVYKWLDDIDSPLSLLRMPEATHSFHGCLVKMRTELTELLTKEF